MQWDTVHQGLHRLIVTVSNTSSVISYDGDDVSTAFPTTFKFLANGDLFVEQSTDGGSTWTQLTIGVDYNVAGAGAAEPGGTVTLTSPLADGAILRITRNTAIIQPVLLQQNGPFPPLSIMAEMDRLTLIAQENDRRIEALAAGAVGSTYTAVRVTDTFTVADPLESNFPRAVAVGVAPVTAVIGRVENLSTPAEVFDEPPTLQWKPVGTTIQVLRIDGLTVGEQYRITYEVRT